MRNLLIISTLLLSACASTQYSSPDLPLIVGQDTTEYIVPEVNIDKTLLKDSPDLYALPLTADFNSIILVTKDNAVLYAECRAKNRALVNILTKSLNIKDSE